MQTVVHLVRHGEVFNPQKILYGRLPGYHLSQRGVRMADTVAQHLGDHDITVLKASPLQRAQETIAPLSVATGLDVITDDDLLEAGNQLEGRHIKGIRSELWNPRLWPLLTRPSQPSWGEPYTVIRDRMMRAVHRAAIEAAGHEAVMVSHQLPIVMVQRHLADKPLAHNPAARRCNLASVTSIIFDTPPADSLIGDQSATPSVVDVIYSEPAASVV